MSKSHIWTGLVLAAAVFTAPAFADGKDTGRRVTGPDPLVPHAHGCVSELDGSDNCHTRKQVRRVYRRPAATPTRRVVHRASAPVERYDFSGFNGGVGAGVDGGYYGGGGGGIVISGQQRFSGVLNSRAAAFTFRHSAPRHAPKPRPRPCCAMK